MPERPDFSEYQDSDNSHFRFLGNLFDSMEDSGLENLPDMPKRDLYKGIDFKLEPRILKHYRQTYIATTLGFGRISLIMQGVLLEMVLKEYFTAETGKTDEEYWTFGSVLNDFERENNERDEPLIPEEKMDYLWDFKDEIRDNWTHDNIGKVAGEKKVNARAIEIDPSEDIGDQIKEAKSKPLDQEMGFDDGRFFGDLFMAKEEKNIYLERFKEVDEFIRWISPKIHEAHKRESL
jgi:hypothetical protein